MHADYLIGSYEDAAAHSASVRAFGFVSRVLRFPLCTREVLETVLRSPACPLSQSRDDSQGTSTVLPRRLFRNLVPRDEPGQPPWTDEDEPLPLLRFLSSHPRIPKLSTDSYDGYALTRAVYSAFVPLIRFLLANGASPECKNSIAVTVAIRRKSLPLVRMLIERDIPGAFREDSAEQSTSSSKKRKRRDDDDGGSLTQKRRRVAEEGPPARGAKRRKLGDRVAVTQEMLKTAVKCDARDIVEYFMKEKGCVPDMQTVLMMGR